MAGAPREKANVEACRRILKRRRTYFVKTTPGGYGARAGMPDYSFCYRGLYGACEVKRPGGRPNTHQRRELLLIEKAGGFVCVADDPSTLEEMLDRMDVVADALDEIRSRLDTSLGSPPDG